MAKARKKTKRRKVSKYNKLQKAVAKRCKNNTDTNRKGVQKAKQDYIKDAIEKGKTPSQAKKTAKKADTCNPFGK